MNWPITYIRWHYGAAFQDITRIWLNYLWFLFHFFSIKLLLKTFFQPFRRVQEEKQKTFNLQDIAETLAINMMMRFVGMVLRTVILAIGLGVILFFFLGGILFYIFWTAFPVAALILVLISLNVINL